jgi:predicted cupin superfamily sugar epimerase
MTAEAVIALLDLAPHPEGGWYRSTWRAEAEIGGRQIGSLIYFLLEAGAASRWHRIDTTEIYLWHAGGPLTLDLSPDGVAVESHVLGPDLGAGQRPQHIVPPGHWQSAASAGPWTLISCVVIPGFEFAHFEMAPPEWRPAEHGRS